VTYQCLSAAAESDRVRTVATMTKITNLEHARALKKMHVPVITLVEKRTFSLDYSNHWADLMNAHAVFIIAVRGVF
jgi:hypothetical protein